jgi:SAM-dependent methyltransferase
MRSWLKQGIKTAIGGLGFEVRKTSLARLHSGNPSQRIAEYLANGRRPWSAGYIEYRREFISKVLSNVELMTDIGSGNAIPDGYGFALCERCIEYPWLMVRLHHVGPRILDAGSTLNHDFVLDQPVFRGRELTVLTLAPEWECHWKRRISYLFADIRNMPLRDGYFDAVCCISTLEHIGLDNSQFLGSHAIKSEQGTHLDALLELRRVVRPGGKVFITVPFGADPHCPTTLVFDEAMITQLLDCFRPAAFELQLFKYEKSGWRTSTMAECATAEYQPWIMLPSAQRSQECPIDEDHASAARAVACLALTR